MAVYGFKIDVEGSAIKSIEGIEHELTNLSKKSKEAHDAVGKHFGGMGEKVRELGIDLKSLVVGGFGLGALFGVGEFAKSSLEAFDKYEEGVAKIEAALTSTGHAAGLSLEELQESAKGLSTQTLFSTSSIMDAQSMLLTFTQIKGTIFNEAIPAIEDFATRYKTDPVQAALQVGKALNDPEKGLNRLTRMGVVFSEQQKEQIKNFMAVGNVGAAQRVMLKELNTEFGGLAKAMAKTDEGKLKMAQKQLAAIKVVIGETISKLLVGLIPTFEKFIKILKDLGPSAKLIFETIISLVSKLFNILEELWPVLKYIIALFIAWKAIQLFDNLIVGIISFYNYMIKLPAAISEIGSGFNKWTMILAGALVSIVMIDQIMKQIKSGGKYGEELAIPYRKELADLQEEEFKLGMKKNKSAEDSLKLKELGEKELDVSKKVSELEGGKGYLQRFFAITTEQVKGMFTSLTDKLKGTGLTKLPDFKPLKGGVGGLGETALSTSALSGAAGGLGEAKVIKIDFHKALMEVNVPGGNGLDILAKAPMSVEMMLRIINNLSQSQGSTM